MSEISVVVVGSTSISSVVGNGDTVKINVGDQAIGGGNGAAATVEVVSVTSLAPTQAATVVNSGTAYAAKLDFGIPRGAAGAAGPANSLSIGSVSTGTTAAVTISGNAPSQSLSFVLQAGPQGPTGPANSLSIGSVTTGATAAVSISGNAPSQSLSFVLPQGPTGPANSLTVGSVTTTASNTASVSITGSAPSQVISFVVPRGPQGDTGPATVIQTGSVTTGEPGTNAAVSTATNGNTVTLSFTIPRGSPGSVNLADETPQPLGASASAGSAQSAARADHIHAAPTSFPFGSLTGVPASFVPSAHTHAISAVSGLQDALDAKQPAGAYLTLVNNLVPSANLPSFVDDVIDVGGTLPATGDVGKIYVVSSGGSTNKIFRWSGSAFIEISPSPGSTDSVAEGANNLYFTSARASAAAPVQSVANRTGTITLTRSDVGLANVPNTDATLRSNHTGTQTASTISDFAAEAAKYGPVVSVAGRTGTITLAQLASSGTASSSTFLRGDGAWAAAGGGGSGNIAEYATASSFPATGASATLYVATDESRVYRWDSSGSTYIELGTSGGTSETADGGDYTGVFGTYAAAPTGVSGTGISSTVSLSWTAPASNGGSAITDYTVQYSANSGSTWTTFARAASASTSATVTGLTRGTAYIFRVAAVNALGNGAFSAASSAITPPVNATAPGQPTNVAGTADDGQAFLAWTAPNDGDSAITDYTVQYSSNGGTSWTTFSDGVSIATSATVTGLTNGTAYVFRVAATNAIGTGSYSVASSAVTPSRGVSVAFLANTDNFAAAQYSANAANIGGTVSSPRSGQYVSRDFWGTITFARAGSASISYGLSGSLTNSAVSVADGNRVEVAGTTSITRTVSAGQSLEFLGRVGTIVEGSFFISVSFTPS